MSRRSALLLALSVCVLQAVAIGFYLKNQSLAGEGNVDGGEKQESMRESDRVLLQQKIKREAGVPVQRKRTDDFITQVAAYPDFDATAAGLNDAAGKDGDVLVLVGLYSSDSNPQLEFAQVLADRRVAKLFAFLSEMPAGEAGHKAAALVDTKLKTHCEALEKIVAEKRKVNGDLRAYELFQRNFHALSAACFLCGVFSEPQVAVNKIDRWSETAGALVDQVVGDPSIPDGEFLQHGCPQKLYVLNLYAMILEQRWGVSAEQVAAEAKMFTSPFQLKKQLYAWDAEANPFDFTVVHRGAEVDDKKMLLEVDFARSWESYSDSDVQRDILGRVRKLIDRLNAVGKAD